MGTEQSMTTTSRIEEVVAELDFTTKDLRDLSRDQKNGMEGLTGFSADAIAHLYDKCKEVLTRLKPVLEENEQLKRLIWEMDEHVGDCCGCLGHIDQEFRDRINAASLSPSIRSNPDGE
jgi:hypothetical protein